ncbi:MAG: DUF1778 domain-containing protein [Pseudomonadaceae bacterium]|nr:DUF1778 domain-containing protein [Pseudomonadaceae bacterium]
MNTLNDVATKPVAINMRVDSSKRNLIDMAAAMLGSDRTSFIVDAACKHAEDVILDKRMFFIDNSAFDAFERALENNSLGDNQCLMNLMQRPKRWA